ncbi:hypothetical protein ACTFIT_002166 [Dictyostelium discoideum]
MHKLTITHYRNDDNGYLIGICFIILKFLQEIQPIVRGNVSYLVCLKYHSSTLLSNKLILTFFCYTGMGSLTIQKLEDLFWKTIEKHKVSVAFTGPHTFQIPFIGTGHEIIDESISDFFEIKIKVKRSRGYVGGVPSIFIKPSILSPELVNENEIGGFSFKLPIPSSFAISFYKNNEK